MKQNKKPKISSALEKLSREGTLRTIPRLDQGQGLYLNHEGRTLLNLASNNYLGLAGSEMLKSAAVQAVMEYGASSSGSRLISGNYILLDRLEELLSRFKNQEKSLVVGSGFAANMCILGALAGRDQVIFSDRLNHASIVDAAILSRARHVRYRHADMDHLLFLLKKYNEHPAKILVTESVFSMDGDTAPLVEIAELCKKHQVLLVVDEAHATGIFGRGRGLVHHLGLEEEIDVHMGTFSKALGSYGGYISSDSETIDLIITRARPFIYSTALPPAAVGASLAALEAVMNNPLQGNMVLKMASDLKEFLRRLGFDVGQSSTQIIPVILKKNSLTVRARQILIDLGLFTGAVRPPTVPENTARLRVSLRADLGDEQINKIKSAFSGLARELELPGLPCP